MRNLDMSYYLELQRRLKDIFLYVDCDQSNFETYSIKIENLFVDVCAFFDSLCQTTIVEHSDRGYMFINTDKIKDLPKKIAGEVYFNMNDYSKLLEPDFLNSTFEVSLLLHDDDLFDSQMGPKTKNGFTIKPFENWTTSSLDWWRAFTKLKHNRLVNIKEATLGRTIFSLGATFIILTLRNERMFKDGIVGLEFYEIYRPLYWQVKGARTTKSVLTYI